MIEKQKIVIDYLNTEKQIYALHYTGPFLDKNAKPMNRKLICLLCYALLTACAFKTDKLKKADAEADKTSWELTFQFVGGKTSVPFDKLYLNGRIPKHRMYITAGNLEVDKGVVIVRYDGIGRANVAEVCDQLNKDKQIRLLSLTEIKFRN